MDVDPVRPESQGVLYVASGATYVAAALRSALTVRDHRCDRAIHLFSDSAGLAWVADQDVTPFTSVG